MNMHARGIQTAAGHPEAGDGLNSWRRQGLSAIEPYEQQVRGKSQIRSHLQRELLRRDLRVLAIMHSDNLYSRAIGRHDWQ
jgi:hypothetical protein